VNQFGDSQVQGHPIEGIFFASKIDPNSYGWKKKIRFHSKTEDNDLYLLD
jgi:hypothetical protein